MIPVPSRGAAAAGVLLALAAPAAGQEACAAGTGGMALTTAAVRPELASGESITGLEFGFEGRDRIGGLHLSAALGYTMFDDAEGAPVSARVRLEHPLGEVMGITLCGALLGGGSLLYEDADGAWTAAGGAALTASRPFRSGDVVLTPYLGVRGLGARATGEILGGDFVARGAGVGVEGGLGAVAGWFDGALRVTADGLDPALGPMPYPTLVVRLVLGWRL